MAPAREPALLTRLGLFVPSFEEFLRQRAFFRDETRRRQLLKKMRPNAINGAITLRRWNMTTPILRVELVAAKKRRPS